MPFMYDIIYICQHGGIGRRTGLKIQRWQHRAGSTPAAGIMIKTRFLGLVFFYGCILNPGHGKNVPNSF